MATGLPAAAGQGDADRPGTEPELPVGDTARARGATSPRPENGPSPRPQNGASPRADDGPSPRPQNGASPRPDDGTTAHSDGPGPAAGHPSPAPRHRAGNDGEAAPPDDNDAPPDDADPPPTTTGGRLARWLRTVPGLAASTIVTTLAAAATTAMLTGALHLWPESTQVALSVETDPMRLDADGDRVQLIPARRFDGSAPKDGCAGLWAWARARGGVDEDRTRMQMTVTNSGAHTVLITGMRAEVVSRKPVPPVVEAACRAQGMAKVYSVDIDLDKPQPHAVYDKNGKALRPDFTVAAGDLETFLITASVTRGAVQWKLAVDLVEDGHRRTVVADGDGKPFTTVSRPAGLTTWELDPHAGDWQKSADGGGTPAGRPGGAS
ncbi:hypothetical protein [Streptomyces sp. NPDC003077]|uniref:hypothetical protein n=1 Tax=Streptomyces sp. NPDC003077 TaxID=3154443 RepID=UPI0033B9A618